MAVLDRVGGIGFWYVRPDTTTYIYSKNGQNSRCSVDIHIPVHNLNLLPNTRSLYQERGLCHGASGEPINQWHDFNSISEA